MQEDAIVAVDLGASSGKCFLGRFDGKQLKSEEIHRFINQPLLSNGHLRWNVAALHQEVTAGLAACRQRGHGFRSVGVDTWGVDYALLGPSDALVDLPITYRDGRTAGCMEDVLSILGRERVYCETGIQFLPFNTLYQLFALRRAQPEVLASARTLLLMPDLFAFLLCGTRMGEHTNASTTQMLNVRDRRWSLSLLDALDLPDQVLPELIPAGTVLAKLRPEIAAQIGLGNCQFTATATHDTASAVAGIPASGKNWAFISCGTWSLVGMELDGPITTTAALAENFTNEAGVGGTIRFLKNVQGMWILQQCQQEWAAGRDNIGGDLAHMAASAPAFSFFLDPDDRQFLNPPSMTAAIGDYCARTRQVMERSPRVVTRCVLESLALKHRSVLRTLSRLTDSAIEVVHIVGGGSLNRLLCQWTADASGLPVLAGPADATAVGNILIQGIALGWFDGLDQARAVLRESMHVERYQPVHKERWDEAEERFEGVLRIAQSETLKA
jgi:rhamnulokinase